MSGRDAQRGFIFQSIIAIIECIERDDWDEVKLEPDTKLDKVDIQLFANGAVLSAIQVKSSKNQFERGDVKKWLEELKRDATGAKEVSLCLVGDLFSNACEAFINQNSKEIVKVPFGNLEEICTGKLVTYVKKVGIDKDVHIHDLELIDASIFSKIHRNSISQNRIHRSEFEEAFHQALPIHGLAKCLTKYVPTVPEIGLMGRDSTVEELCTMLDDVKCIVLVSGIGGIGKTAVMQMVCNRIISDRNNKNHVAWISCGTSLEDDLMTLCQPFGIPRDIGRQQAFDVILREMKSVNGNLYLFMDDMRRIPRNSELGILNALRPNVHIMITSRHGIKGVPQKNITELDQDSAIDMFYGYYGRDNKREYLTDVRQIINSESVRRHTLLIELLAKAAGYSFCPLDEFRKELEKKGFFEISTARIDTGHDENATIEESIKKLYDITDLSAEKKKAMSLFTIFTPEKEIYGEVVKWAGLDENDINGLINLGWLVRTNEGFMIHQIVKDSLARQVGDSIKLEEYGKLIGKVIDTKHYISRELDYVKARDRLVVAEDVAGNLDKRFEGLINVGEWTESEKELLYASSFLSNSIAGTLADQGDYDKSTEYYDKAIIIREKVLGTDHPETASVYNNIALVYYEKGDYEKALEYYNMALTIHKKVFGTEHKDITHIYNNIALVYAAKGEYNKALELHKKSLSIEVSEYGIMHQYTATTYNNIALIYYYQGDCNKALVYYDKAMNIREQVLGKEHPDTATVYSNIATVYHSIGDLSRALEYFEKSLHIRERVLGSEHPNTAVTYNNLANVYSESGDFKKAIELKKKALKILERVFGNKHPTTATASSSLGSVYQNRGNYAKALKYYEKAYSIRKRILEIHPDTADSCCKIGDVYCKLGEISKGLENYREALNIYNSIADTNLSEIVNVYIRMIAAYYLQEEYEKAIDCYKRIICDEDWELSINDKDKAVLFSNIGNVYRAMQEYEKALELLVKASDLFECVYGIEHTDTATGYNNIGLVYFEKGDYGNSLDYYRKALNIREKLLGTRHASTATIYHNIGMVHVKKGDIVKALEMLKKSLSVLVEVYGENHPKTMDERFLIEALERK